MSEHLPALTVKAPDHPLLPGRTAAHKAPLSPPAHAPVPRGDVDKRGSVGVEEEERKAMILKSMGKAIETK